MATLKKVKSSMEGMISAKIKEEKTAKVTFKTDHLPVDVFCCPFFMINLSLRQSPNLTVC